MLHQIATICALLARVQCNTEIRFLAKVARFESSSHFDYFYQCDASGNSLQWYVNEGNAGKYSIRSKAGDIRTMPNIPGIISILLSLRNKNNQLCLTSMLMVSRLQEPRVACSGNSQTAIVENTLRSKACFRYSNKTVKMALVLADDLGLDNYKIYLVLCHTYGTSLSWLINGTAFSGFFINRSPIGKKKTEEYQNDTMLLYRGAILIQRRHRVMSYRDLGNRLTSLLLVIDNDSAKRINYTCTSDTQNISILLPKECRMTTDINTGSESSKLPYQIFPTLLSI